MQTFLPYEDFAACARVLDSKRLGKQRVEVLQLLNALTNPAAKGWINHPATKMWRGHESALARYGIAICDEWARRGFRDTVRAKLLGFVAVLPPVENPAWLGDESFHSSHRSNLLRKYEEHYRRLGWTEPTHLPYIWPSEVLSTQ